MRVAYFDTFSGIAGDMTLGALIDLGVPLAEIQVAAPALGLSGVEVRAVPRTVSGIRGIDVKVVDRDERTRSGHRSYAEIRGLVESASLAEGAIERALKIFSFLARAEAAVHGTTPEEVHFHEVGAVDSLVDVVGTAVGLEYLGVSEIHVGMLPLGNGFVKTQHGVLPVPAPATVELLRGWPVRPDSSRFELVTPTGAAIVAALASQGPPPDMRVVAVGYGCGDRVLEDRPNVLRILLGEPVLPTQRDEVVCLEANVDDLSAEIFGHMMDRLFAAGALDVFLMPIQMKKNRPATLLRVLAAPDARDRLASVVFQETSTIGLRYSTMQRIVLPRKSVDVATRYGTVAVRVAQAPHGTTNVAPEYESCKRAAEAHGVPLKIVYQAAIAAHEQQCVSNRGDES